LTSSPQIALGTISYCGTYSNYSHTVGGVTFSVGRKAASRRTTSHCRTTSTVETAKHLSIARRILYFRMRYVRKRLPNGVLTSASHNSCLTEAQANHAKVNAHGGLDQDCVVGRACGSQPHPLLLVVPRCLSRSSGCPLPSPHCADVYRQSRHCGSTFTTLPSTVRRALRAFAFKLALLVQTGVRCDGSTHRQDGVQQVECRPVVAVQHTRRRPLAVYQL
jgi:hypothetical protein